MNDNLSSFGLGVDLWVKKVRNMSEQLYQEMIWDLFKMILRETPQSSGRAVAHWNIGIGAPDTTEYPDAGDFIDVGTEVSAKGASAGLPVSWFVPAHQKGDERWMRVARDRNRPIMQSIRYTDKVYISNFALGDEKAGGPQDFYYLEAYMASGHNSWVDKLRAVNRGRSVQECVHVITERWSTRGYNFNTTRNDRVGGYTLGGL